MTFSLIVNQPRMFAQILGRMLFLDLEDQIVFSDGCNIVHPRPGLEAFRTFEMPQDLVEGMGFPALTDEIKAKILGGNAARLHGLDIEQLNVAVKDDAFARRRQNGHAPAWGRLRRPLAEE
jgi:hypothetical protein